MELTLQADGHIAPDPVTPAPNPAPVDPRQAELQRQVRKAQWEIAKKAGGIIGSILLLCSVLFVLGMIDRDHDRISKLETLLNQSVAYAPLYTYTCAEGNAYVYFYRGDNPPQLDDKHNCHATNLQVVAYPVTLAASLQNTTGAHP